MFCDASLDFCGLANVRWRGSAVYVCHAHIWHCSGPQPVCQFMLFKFHFQSNVKLCTPPPRPFPSAIVLAPLLERELDDFRFSQNCN